jgi:hypothetical protein
LVLQDASQVAEIQEVVPRHHKVHQSLLVVLPKPARKVLYVVMEAESQIRRVEKHVPVHLVLVHVVELNHVVMHQLPKVSEENRLKVVKLFANC